MDAVTLVLPAATVANPGSNMADAATLGAGAEAASIDFSALLAAGLTPPAVPTPPTMPQTDVQASEAAQEEDAAAGLASEPDAALLAAPAALHTSVMAHAAAEDGHAHGRNAAQLAAEAATNASTAGKADAALAAEPATIAADPAARALLAGMEDARATQARVAAEPAHAAGAESSAFVAHTLQAPAHTAPAQPTAVLDLAAPVHGPDFAQALSQQVVWMADKDAQIAELRINPPELGPVEVRLHVSGDEASVQFSSAHAEVRNILESAIARLRESMAQAGIQLGEASVSAESFRERGAQQSGAERGAQQNARAASELAWTPTPIAAGVRRGLVDLFA